MLDTQTLPPRLPEGRWCARRHVRASRREPLTRRPSRTPARASIPTMSAASSPSTAKGVVTLYSGKVELGTGAADRDHADRRRRTVGAVRSGNDDPGRHALTPNQGPTYASLSIQDGGMQIRRAAATAREALARPGREQARRCEGRACRSRGRRHAAQRRQRTVVRRTRRRSPAHDEGRTRRRR